MGGKQCAILVPTTILAWQHYQTALSRMEAFPVKIGLLSRFATAKQKKDTLKGLAEGTVDLVVGTHSLLQKDVRFKDLGLVIVDEEQRFGVKHKEKLKETFIGVDMLTLSATPIPRTLNMACLLYTSGRQHHHRGRARRRAGHRPGAAGEQTGLGQRKTGQIH